MFHSDNLMLNWVMLSNVRKRAKQIFSVSAYYLNYQRIVLIVHSLFSILFPADLFDFQKA